jgi:DNA invertase Pin-like site-specific DNA recombinase
VSTLEALAAAVEAEKGVKLRVEQLAREALSSGAGRATVARILGVSRATLYRRFADCLVETDEAS